MKTLTCPSSLGDRGMGVCVSVTQSCLTATPWTLALQAPLSLGFSRQEYWRGLPFSSPGDLPHPGTEPGSPALHTVSLHLCHQGSPEVWVASL